jgi:hypothetical protein
MHGDDPRVQVCLLADLAQLHKQVLVLSESVMRVLFQELLLQLAVLHLHQTVNTSPAGKHQPLILLWTVPELLAAVQLLDFGEAGLAALLVGMGTGALYSE